MHILTLPTFHYRELNVLKEILEWPHVLIHIRKPQMSKQELGDYLAQFTKCQHEKLILHGYPELARKNGISKTHYSTIMRNRNSAEALSAASVISTSTHSWAEFNSLDSPILMAFIGPVFTSISKPGYHPTPELDIERRQNYKVQAIALGGLSSTNISSILASGYDDFGLCGAIWQANSPINEAKRCYELIQTHHLPYLSS